MFSDFLVTVLVSVASAAGFHALNSWTIARKIYSLECDVADLQTKILSEIKKRAQQQARKKPEEDLLEAINSKTPPAAPPEPWWVKYASGGMKQ